MKRTSYSLIVGALAIMLSAVTVSAQSTQPTPEQQKQKEAESQKKLQTITVEEQQKINLSDIEAKKKAEEEQQKAKLSEMEAKKKAEEELQKMKALDMEAKKKLQIMSEEVEQKLKMAEMQAKKKIISEEEFKKKVAEIEAGAAERKREYERQLKGYEFIQKQHMDAVKDIAVDMPMVVIQGEKGYKMVEPVYFSYSKYGQSNKPGSSWEYARQVLEATFSNELTMTSGDERSVSLSVSGDCAEGSITVAIIMPDGKQLSEVVLDENGSLNWRKNYQAGENNGWKNGKWIFRIKAKNATGNLRISMNSD